MAPSSRRQRRSSAPHLDGFESVLIPYNIQEHPNGVLLYVGAGNRTRTGTDFTPRDFKSLVSTYSTMPASLDYRNTNFLFRQGEERRILGKITTAVGILCRPLHNDMIFTVGQYSG